MPVFPDCTPCCGGTGPFNSLCFHLRGGLYTLGYTNVSGHVIASDEAGVLPGVDFSQTWLLPHPCTEATSVSASTGCSIGGPDYLGNLWGDGCVFATTETTHLSNQQAWYAGDLFSLVGWHCGDCTSDEATPVQPPSNRIDMRVPDECVCVVAQGVDFFGSVLTCKIVVYGGTTADAWTLEVVPPSPPFVPTKYFLKKNGARVFHFVNCLNGADGGATPPGIFSVTDGPCAPPGIVGPLPPRVVQVQTALPVMQPSGRPGTELKALLSSLGINPGGCACAERAQLMDALGVTGCLTRRAEILDWLRAEYARLGWGQSLAAASRAALQGLPVNPLDPAAWLFDEALRRAARR